MIAVTGKNLSYQLFDEFLLAKICKEYYIIKNIIPLVNPLSDKEIQCAILLTWLYKQFHHSDLHFQLRQYSSLAIF